MIKPIKPNTLTEDIYILIKENPNIGMREISQRLGKNIGTVSGTINRLINIGWVIKSEGYPATYSINPNPKEKGGKVYQLTNNKLKAGASVYELIELLESELEIVEEQINHLKDCKEKLQISIRICKERLTHNEWEP